MAGIGGSQGSPGNVYQTLSPIRCPPSATLCNEGEKPNYAIPTNSKVSNNGIVFRSCGRGLATARRGHRDQSGSMSILSVFAVLLLTILLGMLMNVGRQVDGKFGCRMRPTRRPIRVAWCLRGG